MNWKDLLAARSVQKHVTSAAEINDLRELIARDLKDAAIAGLSDDRRFATAYNAALQLSKMAIACSGHRVSSGPGHHQKTFEAVKVALGSPEADAFADYFDTCRRKRNSIDYNAADVVTETEAAELLEKTNDFRDFVEDWIMGNYPSYRSKR